MGIGPSTKETSLHHFNDPLVKLLSEDRDIDFLGVIVAGTPQSSFEKDFVAARIGDMTKAMRADGAIMSIDGWGNSHIDYATAMEEIGRRGVETVGLSFVGTQAAFVITNKYMDHIIDYNKSEKGIETEVVGENNIVELDAKKAIASLKILMNKKGTSPYSGELIQRGKLKRRYFNIKDIKYDEETYIEDNILYIRKGIEDQIKDMEFIQSISFDIINPYEHNVEIDSIMDFIPIAVKTNGIIGEGDTNVIRGVTVMTTAVDSSDSQASNIGSSNGILKDQVVFNRAGTPREDDFIIRISCVLKENMITERKAMLEFHRSCDLIIEEIRSALRKMTRGYSDETVEYIDYENPYRKKVVLVKQVGGQGCMYDTGLVPKEPAGVLGFSSVIDIRSTPVVFSANQIRDGVIKSMT